MNQPRLKPENTGLLVSVRNATEARLAHSTALVSIIDLKEPQNGSLGCVSFETAKSISQSLPEDAIKSIALGEVVDGPVWPNSNSHSRHELLLRFQYAKVGLAGLADDQNWLQHWSNTFDQVPSTVQRVAVAYADHERANSPKIKTIIESANLVRCNALLIDTFCKENGSLLDMIPMPELKSFVRHAKSRGLKTVIAGSLREKDLPHLQPLAVDFIAVRGAICSEDRCSLIDVRKITSIAHRIADLSFPTRTG